MFYENMCSKYPVMFAEKDLPASESAMHWGIQCGAGWYPLIEMLLSVIEYRVQHIKCTPVIITEIKEKYGTMRFRFRGGDDTIRGMVHITEQMSATLCECCGTNQNVTRSESQTVCVACLSKEKTTNE